MEPSAKILELTKSLLVELPARAAGFWRVDGDRLDQLAFVPSRDLNPEVARDFAESTRTVFLDPALRLGIIGAAVSGRPSVSRVDELPPDVGSGRWLRAFGAVRSIAVPLNVEIDKVGVVRCGGVFAVALATDCLPDDASIIELIGAKSGELIES